MPLRQATLDDICRDRRKVYGHPRENHRGIAQMWTPLLQPHALTIRRGEPLPEHVVALLMAALKIDRMRLVFRGDNYDDAFNYLRFAADWQRDYDRARAASPPTPEHIFVAGPYSAATQAEREAHVQTASDVGLAIIRRGHLVYVPHTMSHPWYGKLSYEGFMAQTCDIIETWATGLYFIGPSKGALLERQWAEDLGLPIYTDLTQIPERKFPRILPPDLTVSAA